VYLARGCSAVVHWRVGEFGAFLVDQCSPYTELVCMRWLVSCQAARAEERLQLVVYNIGQLRSLHVRVYLVRGCGAVVHSRVGELGSFLVDQCLCMLVVGCQAALAEERLQLMGLSRTAACLA
jgi:hypothetical protein